MKKYVKFLIIGFFLIFGVQSFGLYENVAFENESPFTLHIVPSSYPTGRTPYSSISIGEMYFYRSFDVVLTNVSDKPLRVWESWNSWGWKNLSFEITLSNGQVIYTEQTDAHLWTKNVPSWEQIPPNRHYVFRVNFQPMKQGGVWDNSILEYVNESTTKCKIKAIYEICQSDELYEENVWMGRVESEEEEYLVYH